MNIQRITLQNFRNVGEVPVTYNFNTPFTAVIGINGKGKSTILQALRVACGTFFHKIPGPQTIGIHNNEIRKVTTIAGDLAEKRPVLVEAEGTLNNDSQNAIWRRRITENSNTNTSSSADIGVISDWGNDLYTQVNFLENDKIALPVIVFFGTNRIWGAGRNTRKDDERYSREIFKEGYHNWYEMKSSTYLYESWLSSYDTFFKIGKEYEGTKEAFYTAIIGASRYIRDLTSINGKLWFRVQMDEDLAPSDLLPLTLHSDGVQFFTSMVAELAYRCVILNGYKGHKAVEESNGVVMIDEIDLHLHPNWQRHIVGDLKKAFPNLQFIVATHSPFIIQSLGSDELINLDDSNPQTFDPDTLPLDKVATEIMGVESIRSEEFEEKFKEARKRLEEIEKNNKTLTTEDYINISKELGNLIKDETNDAVLKALIDKQNKQEEKK